MNVIRQRLGPADPGPGSGAKRIPFLLLWMTGLITTILVALPYVYITGTPMFGRRTHNETVRIRRKLQKPKVLIPPSKWYKRAYRPVSLKFNLNLQARASPLFSKLPPEIRNMIYDEVLGVGQLTHIKSLPEFEEYRDDKGRKHIPLKRITHALCSRVGYRYCECFGWKPKSCSDCHPEEEWYGVQQQPPSASDEAVRAGHDYEAGATPSPELRNIFDKRIGIPLLQTCRQIHAEAVALLYTARTFTVYNLWDLIDFSTVILPDRLAMIQSLDLQWRYYDHAYPRFNNQRYKPGPYDDATWSEFWEVISTKMTGLRELKASLNVAMYHDHLSLNEWVGPMLALRTLRVCSLQLEGKTTALHSRPWDPVPFEREVGDILEKKLEEHMTGLSDFSEDPLYNVVSLDSYEGGLW